MPPQLALLLCTAFVWYMLRFDRQLSQGVSHAVWLPTLWVFSIGTKALAVWLGSSAGDEWGSPWDQYFQLSLLIGGLAVLARRQFDWGAAVRDHPWLFLLVAYMLLSCTWSDLPFTSLKRWVRQLVALPMAFVVLSEENPRRAVESILRRTAYVLLPFSIVLIKYFPHYGVEFHRWSGGRMWVGVSQQKNGLARVCIIALLFLVCTFLRRWRQGDKAINRLHALGEGLLLLLGLYMLLLPDGKASSTSIAALSLGVSTLFALGWLHRRRIKVTTHVLVVIVIALIGVGIGLPLSGKGLSSGLAAAMGRDETLTGRADTWAELVPIAMQHPVLGCGFDSYWTPITRERHRMSHAHNAYLEVFNELGVVGCILFASFLLSIASQANQTRLVEHDWGSFCVAFLLMVLLHGAAESSLNSLSGHMGGNLLLLGVSCSPIVRSSTHPEVECEVLASTNLCCRGGASLDQNLTGFGVK